MHAIWGALYTIILLSTSCAQSRYQIWRYFTNWNLVLQIIGYSANAVEPDPAKLKHTWLKIAQDVAVVASWMVALSYSYILIRDHDTLLTEYDIVGKDSFWIGNVLVHYIPPFLTLAFLRTDMTHDYTRTLIAAGIVLLLALIWSTTHDLHVEYNTKLNEIEGMGISTVAICFIAVGLFFVREKKSIH